MPFIRSGRCDECRRRKRKCDESRPACSACVDRKVVCRYSFEVSKFIHLHQQQSGDSEQAKFDPTIQPRPHDDQVVLNIRSSKDPPSGTGVYHTFVPLKKHGKRRAIQVERDVERNSLSIFPPSGNQTDRLRLEFGSVLYSATSAGLRVRMLGKWLELCIPRIGTCPVLDRAAACLISGHKAKHGIDDRAMRTAKGRYGEALTLLRDTVAKGIKCVTAEVIAATKMLMLYEIMVGAEVAGWISHCYGAINLFLAVGPEACQKDFFMRTLFFSTYAQAWHQGLMIGKPSVFDQKDWLDIPPLHTEIETFPEVLPSLFESYTLFETLRNLLILPSGDEGILEAGATRRFHVITKMARLTSLVRAVRENPTNDISGNKAIQLAEELLALDWTVEAEWEEMPEVVPTKRAEDADLVPWSFKWSEDDYYSAASLQIWWVCKILLSGLCQSLYACGWRIEGPSLSELQEEERRCATLICMSVDYNYSLAPYACVVTVMNLQHAWGVYWRQKDFSLDMDGYAMAEWLRRRGNEFIGCVSAKRMRSVGLAWSTDRFQGGPIIPPSLITNKTDQDISDNSSTPQPRQLEQIKKVESESVFQESIRNIMLLQNTTVPGSEELFRDSMRSIVWASRHTHLCDKGDDTRQEKRPFGL